MRLKFLSLLLLGGALAVGRGGAQQVVVKTNAAYWATATPNLAVETATGARTSIEVAAGYNPFTFNDYRKWKHWLVQPEFRYWNCGQFNRSFWGVHALGGEMNVDGQDVAFGFFDKAYQYEGWFAGAGVSYGYQWYLGPHWSLEATVGAGYVYVDYRKYDCGRCTDYIDSGHRNYVGPTKIGVSIVYLFGSKK